MMLLIWIETHNTIADRCEVTCIQSMTVRETLEFARKCQMGSTPQPFSPVVEGRKLAGQPSTAAGEVPVLNLERFSKTIWHRVRSRARAAVMWGGSWERQKQCSSRDR